MAAEGHQTALMVPTEILARQHLSAKLLAPQGVSCDLLGNMKAAERGRPLSASSRATGSSSSAPLLSPGVAYRSLGLVICDEQHRFGVRQRQRLSLKAGRTAASRAGHVRHPDPQDARADPLRRPGYRS